MNLVSLPQTFNFTGSPLCYNGEHLTLTVQLNNWRELYLKKRSLMFSTTYLLTDMQSYGGGHTFCNFSSSKSIVFPLNTFFSLLCSLLHNEWNIFILVPSIALHFNLFNYFVVNNGILACSPSFAKVCLHSYCF